MSDDVRLTVRLPHALWEQMVTLARAQDRMLNGEIVRALREHVRRETRKKQGQE